MSETKYVVSMYEGENPGNIYTRVFDNYADARSEMIKHCDFTKEDVERLENGDYFGRGVVLDKNYAGIMCGLEYAEENGIEFDRVATITEVTF